MRKFQALIALALALFVTAPAWAASEHLAKEVEAATPNLRTFTGANFEAEVLRAEMPVLVFFTATWVGPGKAMMPVIESLADRYAGKVIVGVVDIDEEPELMRKYAVRSVPTSVVFKGGAKAGMLQGMATAEQLIRLLVVLPD